MEDRWSCRSGSSRAASQTLLRFPQDIDNTSISVTVVKLARNCSGNAARARCKLVAMRAAIVHYWLLNRRGGEKVLEALCRLLPEADIFTLFWRRRRSAPSCGGTRSRLHS